MKLLVDNKIPFFREYLKKIKNHDQFIIKYFDDNSLENNDCLNADALFIRSTTRVNSENNQCHAKLSFISSPLTNLHLLVFYWASILSQLNQVLQNLFHIFPTNTFEKF